MPWTLTTPIQTGGLGYPEITEARLVMMRHDSRPPNKQIILVWEYGNTVGDDWIPAPAPDGAATTHAITGDEYDAFLAANLATYTAAKTALFGH